MNQEKTRAFLKKYELESATLDPERTLTDFQIEMEKGLAGKTSSLAMIPTYITVGEAVPAGKPVVVIDAGGTNLRIATVVFESSGEARIEQLDTFMMPGIDEELSKDAFFSQLASYVAPVAGTADQIGFCFSYPAAISPERDGKLIRWTKEIKAPEVEGAFIGKNLLAALGSKGAGKKITILNDTIATLLAGKSASEDTDYESYIGFILGTGTNTAYVEKNSNITKYPGLDPAGAQAINVESGNFNKCPRGPVDLQFDETTQDPGKQAFEKMISGGYLGPLCLQVLQKAVEETMFGEAAQKAVQTIRELSSETVSDVLAGKVQQEPFTSDALRAEDVQTIKDLFSAVVRRAALLAAINISAAVVKSGAGDDPNRPICINIDGSTYYKLHGFETLVKENLKKILQNSRHNKSYVLTFKENAPLIGAAVAGLTH